MIAARDEGDSLDDDELTSLVFLILSAGYENVVNLIGNAVLALLDNPTQYAVLRGTGRCYRQPLRSFSGTADRRRSRSGGSRSRMYRSEASSSRRARQCCSESRPRIATPRGSPITASTFGSKKSEAERRAAELPERLAFDRAVGGQLALGQGIHYCLGVPLARMEIAIAVEALLDRLPELALAVPTNSIEWRKSPRTRGVVALPITF
ncbi:cytochrome P450 [Kribbella qitaiheensis]|uniref:cytochrome P450 n=1 Tax=Kribbella qitaiheensis TaxID=1544730 RepID=UPI001FE7617A|nr:cytochrome P450 [Kribbella qitaiheensis]